MSADRCWVCGYEFAADEDSRDGCPACGHYDEFKAKRRRRR